MSNARWIDTAEAAKMLRKQLKQNFPKTKFSVRTERYSGGSSIRVQWVDGPTEKQVRAISDPFQGKGFDGMIDMEYSIHSWLLPDGSLQFASTDGTRGSMGVYDAYKAHKPHPDAELVYIGAYVSTRRDYSQEFISQAVHVYKEKYVLHGAVEVVPEKQESWGFSSAYFRVTDNADYHPILKFLGEHTL